MCVQSQQCFIRTNTLSFGYKFNRMKISNGVFFATPTRKLNQGFLLHYSCLRQLQCQQGKTNADPQNRRVKGLILYVFWIKTGENFKNVMRVIFFTALQAVKRSQFYSYTLLGQQFLLFLFFESMNCNEGYFSQVFSPMKQSKQFCNSYVQCDV